MSSKKVTTRLYSISDADLKQKADHVVALVIRDLTDFNTRNVTEQTIASLQTLIEDFEILVNDQKPQATVIEVLQEKNRVAKQVRILLCKFGNIEILQNELRHKFNGLKFDKTFNMNDNDLCRLAKRVVSVAATLNAKLPTDVKVKDITDLAISTISFDVSIDAQHEAIELRDRATEAKVKQGNVLWIEIVRLCLIGKSLYENEAKYSDYVLTESLSFFKKDSTPVQ